MKLYYFFILMKLFFNNTYKNRYENISIRNIASLSNDNTNLDPWFITGFSDGWATFTFNIIHISCIYCSIWCISIFNFKRVRLFYE